METSENWVVNNLSNALNTWNEKMSDLWQLVTQSPQTFKGGAVWNVIEGIHHSLIAVGLALLVLFFVMGIAKSTMNLTELKRPEQALRFFLRFVLAKTAVTYGMDIMLAIFRICQGVMNAATSRFGSLSAATASLPEIIKQKILAVGFWESIPLWAVTILGSLFITVLSFVMIMSIYGRFFRLYTYTALAPVPPVHICRGRYGQHRHSFPEILCGRLPGERSDRNCLYDLYGVFVQQSGVFQ